MSALRQAYWNDESGGQIKYLIGALLIHLLLGVLLVGFNWHAHQVVVPQLAINAVLVDRNTLNQVVRQKAVPTPPAPSVEDSSKQQELEKQRQEEEREKQAQLKQQQLELQQTQDKERQRLAAEAEQKKQVEQAEQQKQQQDAEKKRLADIQQKQHEIELKRQADADAKAQAAKEAELKAQLAAEEGRANAVNSGALNQYAALILQKVTRNWIRPPTVKPGLECEVLVTQAVGGTVLTVEMGRCNGDSAVVESIKAAVLRSSPLPAPPDPRVFQRNFPIMFRPTE